MRNSPRLTALSAALLAGLLAACGEGTTAPSAGLTQSEAQDVADVVTTDIDLLLDASTVVTGTGVALAPGIQAGPPPCTPTVTPNPPDNSDGDMVPDSARFDFSGCGFTRGDFEYELGGLIDITDPATAPDDFGIRFVFTGFTQTRTLTGTDRTRVVELNGTRQVTGNSSSLSHLITNFESLVTLPHRRPVSHVKNWNASFTADQAGSIAAGQPVPSGTLNVAGTSEWTRGGEQGLSINLTTSGLHYDAGCTVAPKFDAGTTTAVVTRGDHVTNVVVEHTACGQYTVTRTQG